MIVWVQEFIWAWRVGKCWRQANGDYGQFLSNIGCYIAYKKLPKDILEQCGLKKI